MKVRCIKDYYDLELNKEVRAGEEFEVSADRGKELTTVNNKARAVLCEEVATADKKPTPKKSAKKAVADE